MRRALSSIAALLLVSCVASSAKACDCPSLSDPAKAARHAEIFKNKSIKVKVLAFSIRQKRDADPIGEAQAVVIRQPLDEEPYPEKLVIYSPGGDEGANCGKASVLFEAASSGRALTLTIFRDKDGSVLGKEMAGKLLFFGCGEYALDGDEADGVK